MRNPFLLCTILLAALPLTSQAQTTLPNVSVTLSSDPATNPPSLLFTVVNNGTTDLPRGSLMIQTNVVHVLPPDGDVTVGRTEVDPPRNGRQSAATSPTVNRSNVIAAGEQVTWRLPISSGIMSSSDAGLYRMYWDFLGVVSNELPLTLETGRDWDGSLLPQATTKPTPRPGSPVETVKQLYRGMDGAFGELNEAIWCDSKSPGQVEAGILLSQRALAVIEFKKEITLRFGPDAIAVGWFFEACDPSNLSAMEECAVTFPKYFREAFLVPKGWERSIHLIRRDGRWYVSADNFIRDGAVDPALEKTNQALKRTTRELSEGKYKEIRDARDAMRLRIREGREP